MSGRTVYEYIQIAMFTGYFEFSVNLNIENQKEKFIILISVFCIQFTAY